MNHPRYKRPAKPKKKWGLRLSFAAVLVCFIYIMTLLYWPVQAAEATIQTNSKVSIDPVKLRLPEYGQSAVGAINYGILASSNNSTTPAPIASITKIVTALVILEEKPISLGQSGPTITFTPADTARYNQYLAAGGSVARADAGLKITEYQVLEGMLVSSANNYADSLAVWAFGSLENYTIAANKYLSINNLKQTTVSDATGFSPDNKSTSHDLIKLGKLALNNSIITNIVSKKSTVIPGVGTLKSTNMLLGSSNIIGIKTGTTDEAGSCLLTASRHNIAGKPITVISVILGAPNHAALYRDSNEIMKTAQSGFRQVKLAAAGQKFGSYKFAWGEEANAIIKKDIVEVVWANYEIKQNTSLIALSESNDQKVGNVSFTARNMRINTALALDRSIEGPSWQWRLLNPREVINN